MEPSQGVYFAANDAVREWAIAFLESFRAFNPRLPLYLIPFDQRFDAVRALQPKYRFEIFDDPSFAALEEIGSRINRGQVSYGPNWFHRFAAFWGPLEEFLYLDARIVVLSDVREMIRARRESGCDLLHLDCALDQVYLNSEFRTRLVRERRVHGFLSGMFASRRGLFDLPELQAMAERADAVREALNTRNADQCYLNFICDTKPVTYASFAEVMPDTSSSGWARLPGVYRSGETYRRWDHGGLEHNRRVLLMNWAGIRLGPPMPYSRLFLRYRLRPENLLKRLQMRLSWALRYVPMKIVERLRSARWFNVSYHRIQHRCFGKPLPRALDAMQYQPPLQPMTYDKPGNG